MPDRFDPRIDILPPAQREIWPQLAPAPDLSFVLYRGTAVALHLGHRTSIDFDFFKKEHLEKGRIELPAALDAMIAWVNPNGRRADGEER
jgi:hypothetical protein